MHDCSINLWTDPWSVYVQLFTRSEDQIHDAAKLNLVQKPPAHQGKQPADILRWHQVRQEGLR